ALTFQYETPTGSPSRLAKITAEDGAETTFQYTGGLVSSITTVNSAQLPATTAWNVQLTRGPTSNLDLGAVVTNGVTVRLFVYDPLHRLSETTSASEKDHWDYGPDGFVTRYTLGANTTYDLKSAAQRGLVAWEDIDAYVATVADARNNVTQWSL